MALPTTPPKPSAAPRGSAGHQPDERPDDGAAPPLHTPHPCRRCGAPVFWGAVLDDLGRRRPRAGGRGWRVVAVEAEPTSDGTVVLAHRDGEGIVARRLRPGEAPPAGAPLRRRHPFPCSGGVA